jgi:hypothetical protein
MASAAPTVRYGDLTQTNPQYRPREWARHRALYAGGMTLLGNETLLREFIPQNQFEPAPVYALRLGVAEYTNYVGEIVDFIVASLGADPLVMEATPPAPPFFAEFQKATDGHQMTLGGLMRRQILTALVCQRAWTLLDLPPTNEGAIIESAADEEQLDKLRALAFPIEPESVVDWGESPSGTIEWAIVKMVECDRDGIAGRRSRVTERYTYYTKETWERYDVTYVKDRGAPPPGTLVKRAADGTHSFGAVPLVPLTLSDGMYALAKLANLAASQFRKRSGANWMQFRAFYPQLVAYLGPELTAGGEVPSQAQQNPGRVTSATYGIGRAVEFGSNDKLEYLSPDVSILETALKDLDTGRDEMHRIMSHMALAADNSAAALGRSGDSKGQDKASAAVILGELGRVAREHAVSICTLASTGRRDKPTTWTAHGMEEFESADAALIANEAEIVQGLAVMNLSATLRELYDFRTAKALLQGAATPDDLKAIRAEIKDAIEKAAEEAEAAKQAALAAAANPSDTPPNNSPSDAPGAAASASDAPPAGDGDEPSIPPPPRMPTGLEAPEGHIVVPAHVRSLPGARANGTS